MTINWSDSADADLSKLEISWEPGGIDPAEVLKAVQTKQITGLLNDTDYTFTIEAVDSSGNTSVGSSVTIHTPWTRLSGAAVESTYPQSICISTDGSIYVAGETGGNFDGHTLTGTRDAFVTSRLCRW